jgi:hypothetical protein
VLSQHVDELQTHGIPERLRDRAHTLRLVSLHVGIHDRLAAALAGRALLLGCGFQID